MGWCSRYAWLVAVAGVLSLPTPSGNRRERMGVGAMGAGLAGGVLAGELCAPLLLLCWLCCWPDDKNSDTSSTGKHPQRPVVAHESGSRRRSADIFGRRFGSSAVSLHLPSTSGKQPLAAHRSHEEIPGRRPSQLEPQEEARYHSAPSVIEEVLRRRAWHHSTRDLHIPLRPAGCDPPEAPAPPCKKHHTNIKSSRNRAKEATRDDVKDTDATEGEANFYIGDARTDASIVCGEDAPSNETVHDGTAKSVYKAKDAKQSLNESIKLKAAPRRSPRRAEPDRSGAANPLAEPRAPTASPEPYPPSSVEAVGYESGACYLAEEDALGALGALGAMGAAAAGALRCRARALAAAEGAQAEWRGARARHASDGDILAPALRPESGAFSESDLELELELELAGSEERPPSYHELVARSPRRQRAAPKETAI